MVITPEILVLLGQILLKYGPQVYNRIVDAIHHPNPSAEDWKLALESPKAEALVARLEAGPILPGIVAG